MNTISKQEVAVEQYNNYVNETTHNKIFATVTQAVT